MRDHVGQWELECVGALKGLAVDAARDHLDGRVKVAAADLVDRQHAVANEVRLGVHKGGEHETWAVAEGGSVGEMQGLKVLGVTGSRGHRDTRGVVVGGSHTKHDVDHTTLAHVWVPNHAHSRLVFRAARIARLAARGQRHLFEHGDEGPARDEIDRAASGVDRLLVLRCRCLGVLAIEDILLALGAEEAKVDVVGDEKIAPLRPELWREKVGLVDEQKAVLKVAGFAHERFDVRTAEQQRVAGVHDLHHHVTSLHDAPKLAPKVEVLLEGGYV
mmetsp:Transcript_4048/g.11746  ORF Transcript_4048/g.11746 Transcript_4048/m.11746 type:complete len:274 (-) Transcript_4048:49-870(-)